MTENDLEFEFKEREKKVKTKDLPVRIERDKPLESKVDASKAMSDLEKEAMDALDKGESFEYMFRKHGECILFKRLEEEDMHAAYKCPDCSYEEAREQAPEKPYTLDCANCGYRVFRQEKVKGKRNKRKKKE